VSLDWINYEEFLERGNRYYTNGNFDLAIADLNEAIRLNPKDAISYTFRGVAYLMKKNYDRAIADFEAALRIDPNDADTKILLEMAQKELGQ